MSLQQNSVGLSDPLALGDETYEARSDVNPKRNRGNDFPRLRFGLVEVLSGSF